MRVTEDQENEASPFWEAPKTHRKFGGGHGLGLRPRVEEVPLRGSGGKCYVLWVLASPRARQGLEKEANCNQGPRASGMPPRDATGCVSKGMVHGATRPETQGREFTQGM